MVECEVARRQFTGTILAGITVARIDIGAGEGHVIEAAPDSDEPQQADDGWQFEAERHRSYLAVVDRDHLDFPLAPQRHRLLPVDNLEGFVRRVQQERLLHKSALMITGGT